MWRIRPSRHLLAVSILLCFLAGCRADERSGSAGDDSPAHIIFVVIDTLRADHLGCYGYDRDTSPELDRFAASAVRFDRVNSQASWTPASLSSILTSLYPLHHGLVHPSDRKPLGETVWTLPEILLGEGYRTAAFIANGVITPDTGIDQGFELFEQIRSLHGGLDRGDLVNHEVFAWLDEEAAAGSESPMFLYVHYMDPHDPYSDPDLEYQRFGGALPPDGERRTVQEVFARMRDGVEWSLADVQREDLITRYDGEIRYVDGCFGRLMDRLEEEGIADNAIVVVISDHGEQFLEHGSLKHATSVYGEEIRIPLLLRIPGIDGGGMVVREPVESIDVMPTLLELLEVEAPKPLDGRSLMPLLRGERWQPRARYAATHHAWVWKDGRVIRQPVVQLAVMDGRDKLLFAEGRRELYDLHSDPLETRDRAAREPERAAELAEQVLDWQARMRAQRYPAKPLERERMQALKKALEELGYLPEEGDTGNGQPDSSNDSKKNAKRERQGR